MKELTQRTAKKIEAGKRLTKREMIFEIERINPCKIGLNEKFMTWHEVFETFKRTINQLK
jgi:hypothetical protein